MTASELGQCMLQGIENPLVQERQDSFLRRLDGGQVGICGLGAGLIGHLNGDVDAAFTAYASAPYANLGPRKMADLLEIDVNLAFDISRRHRFERYSIQEMATDLIEKGKLRTEEVQADGTSPFFKFVPGLSSATS